MATATKVKWIVGLVLLFLLFLATNLNDRKNYRTISNSVETIYADRLIAKGIIFNLAQLVQEKEIAYLAATVEQAPIGLESINQRMDTLVGQFGETSLTREEKEVFTRLQEHMSRLVTLENTESSVTQLRLQAANVRKSLYKLSDIQMEEGRNEMFASKRASATIDLFTYIELALLILIAIAILAIFAQEAKKDKAEELE
ncbi:MCP four helix bundle domain-containing protein [Neolewinella antarctica]|uniref:Chemotaxis methyl-accepting receptor HlyB-like 4HB MCP domain-containing protein n=1 Tax=Neolewinella antarctica TaxID=442734 RepID=A0ABX0XDC9_9BACT|nr:MCP four helix bundle domain-containing protein [Neolewinella antarctica]NJC26762.1 hypothetical protein [Neolewinella antarctica]